jgi:succinate dehydrogenase / fumarate reductase cytochrome b subunit
MHLHHGVWSAQQTLGLTQRPSRAPGPSCIAPHSPALVVVGFAIPPLSILFGLVK